MDIDAIYSVIDDAQQFVYVATMEYLPIVRDHNETRLVNARNLPFVVIAKRNTLKEAYFHGANFSGLALFFYAKEDSRLS